MRGHDAFLFFMFAELIFATEGFEPGNGEARAKNFSTFFINCWMVEHLWLRVMLS